MLTSRQAQKEGKGETGFQVPATYEYMLERVAEAAMRVVGLICVLLRAHSVGEEDDYLYRI